MNKTVIKKAINKTIKEVIREAIIETDKKGNIVVEFPLSKITISPNGEIIIFETKQK